MQGRGASPPAGTRSPLRFSKLPCGPAAPGGRLPTWALALRLGSQTAGSSALGAFASCACSRVCPGPDDHRAAHGVRRSRDGVLGSLDPDRGPGGAGLLRFRTLLENTFHRRIYLVLMLIEPEPARARTWKLGWLMRQLIPFRDIVGRAAWR